MPTRLSTVLGISRKLLKDKGVYNTMIDFDSKLHIDPALLSKCKIKEFIGADEKVATYFNDVLLLIKGSKKENDALWKAALKKLTFGEGLNTGLGYSSKGRGSGIGREMAINILSTVKDIVNCGVEDPRIFELVPIFEDKVGPDRISDMISIILSAEFAEYTRRITTELNVKGIKDSRGKDIVFVPRILLNDLPIIERWGDRAIAADYNGEVRGALNRVIGLSWKKLAIETKKSDFKRLLLKNPELLKALLKDYKNRTATGYDFLLDHMGITIWDVLGPEAAIDNPLNLRNYSNVEASNILDLVTEIAHQFKKLIENNGLVEHLYDEKKKRRPERFPQLLFYAIADSYCTANNLDLNREINAGSGALDFKVSRGNAKVNLEVKYSSNPKLIEGFTKQLPVYNAAEGIQDQHSIYLVLRVNDKQDDKLNEINAIIAGRADVGSPQFIVVDAIQKPSASKR